MGNCIERQEELYIALYEKREEIIIKKFINSNILKKSIKRLKIKFYNLGDLINKENKEDLICPICFFILKNPISCSERKNSHSFCKECIDNYLKENDRCPICKLGFEYAINNEIQNELNKLLLNCLFKKEGCLDIIPYQEYLYHINNCGFYNMEYECCVMKYNYKNKEFKKCGFSRTLEKVIKHFELNEFIEYRCIFCNEFIFQMKIIAHMKNKCKFGIIKYENGNIYWRKVLQY